jgi:hypothetical protein
MTGYSKMKRKDMEKREKKHGFGMPQKEGSESFFDGSIRIRNFFY